MSKKNTIITCVVAGVALLLVVLVVIVEFFGEDITKKILGSKTETEIVSEIIVVSETNEQGEMEYLTMVTKYAKPKVSSDHSYKYKPTTTKKPTSTEKQFVEQTNIVQVTDENGIPQYNPDGSPVTEVHSYTVPADSITTTTKAPPKTSAVVVTDENGAQQTDANGNPVTEVVTYTETITTTTDPWSNVSQGTSNALGLGNNAIREDSMAQTVVDQINAERKTAGLEPLAHSTGLKSSARMTCYALADPNLQGAVNPNAYTLTTTYGGSPIYHTVVAANRDRVMSADTTQIGVGIISLDGKYYTAVIFG